uniref:Uncharacterized protein n=1 Tax=Romanomermis culicivorax TaxID=13658 RepID=A0A915IVJ3_ROMCU
MNKSKTLQFARIWIVHPMIFGEQHSGQWHREMIRTPNSKSLKKKRKKCRGPPNGCRIKQYLVTDFHVAYSQPQVPQDNRYFLVD